MRQLEPIRFTGHVTADDPRACYDLGVAFLVMGLAEKALAYLIHAAADPDWLPACSAVLGAHFLDSGAPQRAAVWYRRGLSAPGVSPVAWVELARGLSIAERCSPAPPSCLETLPLAA